ncbi:MAG TPA: hypothetical protein VGS08_04295 [Candidatus Saccharimonadales bacterium]|nr:hypothetical protein [Candidatus Saccharimonadales bacterium]
MYDDRSTGRVKTHLLLLKIGILAAVLLAMAGIVVVFLTSETQQTPSALTQTARTTGYTLYYPKLLPKTYNFEKNSVITSNGLVIFVLVSGSNNVKISEQSIPNAPPDLSHLVGFTHFHVPAGDAALGHSLGQSMGIVMNNTTLITISGSKGVSSDVIRAMMANLRSLPSP